MSDDTCKVLLTWDDKLYKNNYCDSYYAPIPNYLMWEIESNVDKKDLHWNFYVLEADNNKHLANCPSAENNTLPIHWKNGYSKGVSIDKANRKIAYWLILW